MIFRPKMTTPSALVLLIPSSLGFIVLFVLLTYGAWIGFQTEKLNIFPGAIFFIALLAALSLPLIVACTESWEIVGSRLIHRIWGYQTRIHSISDIETFAPVFLRGIQNRWITIQGKRVDRMLFPSLYTEQDREAFERELRKQNPKIRFSSSWT